MVKVLIPTKPDDGHAVYVKLALEKKGHTAVLWYTSDYPTLQTHSFEVIKDQISWQAKGTDFDINNDSFDVVWLRRPSKPVLSDDIHVEDRENAKNENTELFKTFWQVIAPEAFWVNPFRAVQTVSCKLLQLKVARQVGFQIPETLISNNPAHITAFMKKYSAGEVIYKTLYPMIWVSQDEMRLVYTKSITLDNLPSHSMLQNTPGIFQKRIPKAYELRVTYMGNCAVTVKLRSQEHPRGLLDWRYIPSNELVVEEYELPPEIDTKCKALMKAFGIVFGCFDFIVTPDKEYYFLEVNEQGQFLWIEDVNPRIKLLDAFTDFLISGSSNFQWRETPQSVSVKHFLNQMIERKITAEKDHCKPASLF